MSYHSNLYRSEYIDHDSKIYYTDVDAIYDGFGNLGQNGYYNLFGIEPHKF